MALFLLGKLFASSCLSLELLPCCNLPLCHWWPPTFCHAELILVSHYCLVSTLRFYSLFCHTSDSFGGYESCPYVHVHDVPARSAVSWIRRGLAGCWPCFFRSVTSPVAGGLASGSTAAWPGLWGDVTHWAWQSPGPRQSAAPLDAAGQHCGATPYMSQNQGNIMHRKKKKINKAVC